MSLSIVVPVYNAEATLDDLVKEIAALRQFYEIELILVNDGSRDGSWGLIRGLAGRHEWVRGIDLMRNFGQHNALLCGVRAARHDVIVTLDDDLQNPPAEVPKLVAKLEEGFDLVYGTPLHEMHGLARNIASIVTKVALQKGMGADVARKVGAFRAFRTGLRESFHQFSGSHVSIDALLSWSTRMVASVTVDHKARTAGVSNYTWRKLLAHAINMMTGFTTLPLRLASLLGFAFTLFGGIVLVYVVARYLVEGASVPGFGFLASIIAIFSGAQLFALGVMGEYLARMHTLVMSQPSYVVRSTTDPAATELPPLRNDEAPRP